MVANFIVIVGWAQNTNEHVVFLPKFVLNV
jgi:hypothetical protein